MILYNTQLNTSKTTGTTIAIAITRPVGVFDGRVAKNAYELVAKHTLAKVGQNSPFHATYVPVLCRLLSFDTLQSIESVKKTKN